MRKDIRTKGYKRVGRGTLFCCWNFAYLFAVCIPCKGKNTTCILAKLIKHDTYRRKRRDTYREKKLLWEKSIVGKEGIRIVRKKRYVSWEKSIVWKSYLFIVRKEYRRDTTFFKGIRIPWKEGIRRNTLLLRASFKVY